jgi:hypothetical protein
MRLTPKRRRILEWLRDNGPATSWDIGRIRKFSLNGHQGNWALAALSPMRRCTPPLVAADGKGEPVYRITPAGLAALAQHDGDAE